MSRSIAQAVAALDTGWLEDLWRRCDVDDATILQEDFSRRSDEVFLAWTAEHLGPVDIGGWFK